MDTPVQVCSQATAICDDFDAALACAVQQVTALHLESPTLTIQPCQAGFYVVVSGVPAPKVAVQ